MINQAERRTPGHQFDHAACDNKKNSKYFVQKKFDKKGGKAADSLLRQLVLIALDAIIRT
jgi:hypothetical protein